MLQRITSESDLIEGMYYLISTDIGGLTISSYLGEDGFRYDGSYYDFHELTNVWLLGN